LDFTISTYERLLKVIRNTGFPVLPVKEHLRHRKGHPPTFFIVRHDVDRRPERALRMAVVENSHRIRATYYFRMIPGVFVSSIVKAIASMGHEIGYHYEILDKAKGDFEQADRIFRQELATMRTVADVETASMHGNPLSRRDNREFWTRHHPEEFGLLGEAYMSMKEKGLVYLTDTGRGWNRTVFNLRDRLSSEGVSMPPFRSTPDLMKALGEPRYGKVYLQVHPNRWSSTRFQWYSQAVEDLCVNGVKGILSVFRDGGASR